MRGLSFIVIAVLCLGSVSCTLQKRHYRKGFYVAVNSSTRSAVKLQSLVLTVQKTVQPLQLVSDHEKIISQKEKTPQPTASQEKNVPAKKITARKLPATILKLVLPKPAYATIERNHVAKAGFRTMLIGMLFLAGAWLSLSQLTGLVYITIILLAISAVFVLVSFITSVNARKDQINNSPGWLVMALIDAVLDILLIIAIALFLISLF